MDPFVCPDPLAERRFAYAHAATRDGDWCAAAEILEQTLELAPDWAPAHFALAEARLRIGDKAGAAAAFEATLRADPADRQGAGPRLAWLQGQDVAALPPAYVARLFDDYAPRFDEHLVETLAYRGPELILAAVEATAPGRRFALALDLGCGSGLMGRAIRDRVARLEGVDLSPLMIAKARASGLYDALEVGDLVGWLLGRAGADLIVAADTLVYLGDLRPVVAAVARALAPEGLFAFTVETGEAPFALGGGLRFRHADAHLAEAAAEAGLSVPRLEAASTRREAGEAALGRVVVMARG